MILGTILTMIFVAICTCVFIVIVIGLPAIGIIKLIDYLYDRTYRKNTKFELKTEENNIKVTEEKEEEINNEFTFNDRFHTTIRNIYFITPSSKFLIHVKYMISEKRFEEIDLIYTCKGTRDADYDRAISTCDIKYTGPSLSFFIKEREIDALEIEEEKQMSKFKVGDIIKGKENDIYKITDENMYKAKVIALYMCGDMRIKILEHSCRQEIGEEYDVMNSSKLFELVENAFYKTLPNDFSGKLTIEKGQVVEKEEKKKEILDEVEKEYLRAVIKPFRKKYHTYIEKQKAYVGDDTERIKIFFETYTAISLPFFKKGTMYKGMELNKDYSLEELGL